MLLDRFCGQDFLKVILFSMLVYGIPKFGAGYRMEKNASPSHFAHVERGHPTASIQGYGDHDGCADGKCTLAEDCSLFTSTALAATGVCANKKPGDWVCCRRNDDLRPNLQHDTRMERPYSVPLLANARPTEVYLSYYTDPRKNAEPQPDTSSTTLQPEDSKCERGRCVKREDCPENLIILPTSESCSLLSFGTRVCCARDDRTTAEEGISAPYTVSAPPMGDSMRHITGGIESRIGLGALQPEQPAAFIHAYDGWSNSEERYPYVDDSFHYPDYPDYPFESLPPTRSTSWKNNNNNVPAVVFPHESPSDHSRPLPGDRDESYWESVDETYRNQPETDTTTSCSRGRCVKRKDCTSRDSIALEPNGICKRRTGRDWVCCASRSDKYPSTDVTPRPSGPTTASYGGRYTTAVAFRSTKKPTAGNKWQRTTKRSFIAATTTTAKPKKHDGCIAGECTLRQDCKGRDAVVLNPTGLCGRRSQEQWVCCLRNQTKTTTTRTPTRTTTASVRLPSNSLSGDRRPVHILTTKKAYTTTTTEATDAFRHQIQGECGIREGVSTRGNSNFRRGKRSAWRNSDAYYSSTEAELIRSNRLPTEGSSIIGRIVGGREAEPYSWPWMAALFKESAPGIKRFLCSGSLINDRFILSAAHVFTGQDTRNASSFLVMLGTHTGSEGIAEYRVRSIKQHPEYVNRYHYNDIALLELEKPVIYSQYISPVCLPPTDKYCEDSELLGRNVTVAGWGDEAFGGKSSDVLKEATFPILSRRTCNASYVQVASNKFPRGITKEMLCAGSPKGGKDACQGDSGGPLTINEGKVWIQVGIVSFGYQCGDPKYPGVYTKVSPYTNWINRNVRKYG